VARIQLVGASNRDRDGVAVVDGVDLDVADGEVVALLGPSGSGKSTLLRMVVGLAEISAGELLLDGEPATDWAPAERDLGMVFQDYAPYPHLSVRDNIAFPLRLARVPADEVRRRVDATAAELELGGHLDRRPSQLSGGQRQRLALARVLVREPGGYLLDEPLSTQDPDLRSRLRARISRTGTTTLYATDDQGEAMALGDRLAVLWRGSLQQVDRPQAVYERPANLVVASSVGSPPANLLPAEVAGATLRLPTVDVPLAASTVDRLGGRDRVVAAVRPEHFEDAALVPDDDARHGVVFAARVESVERTGSGLLARLRHRDAGPVPPALAALREDPDGGRAEPVLVARLDAASTAGDRPVARVWLDRRRILLFDADTGAAVGPALGSGDPPSVPDGP
jgi:multiple sugar transport system ATP-binding protein